MTEQEKAALEAAEKEKRETDEKTRLEALKKRKEHPLGKGVKVKVRSLSPTDKKSQIFVSINAYTFEFQQGTEIVLPEGVVKFLETATRVVHTLNDKGFAVNKNEELYAVSRLGA